MSSDQDEALARDIAARSRNSAIRDMPNLSYFRQAGGCVEASQQDDETCDIIHFCTDEDALQFVREFAEFIRDVPRRDT